MYHTFECVLLKIEPKYDTGMERLALRTVARILDEEKSNSTSVGSFFGYQRKFHDLLSHTDLVDKSDLEGYREVSDDLTDILSGRGLSIPKDLILEVLPRLNINACTVEYHEFIDRVSLGYALYLGGSKADHSCAMSENYIEYFDGNRLTYRALNDFSVSDPLKLKTSYIPYFLTVGARRQILQERYFFTCECERCISELKGASLPREDILMRFINSPIDRNSLRWLMIVYKDVLHLPNEHFLKNALFMKFLVGKRQPSIERTIFLGSTALGGTKYVSRRAAVLSAVCRELTRFGANYSSHESYGQFKHFHELALATFTDVYGEGHPFVDEIARMDSSRTAATAERTPGPRDAYCCTKLVGSEGTCQ